MYDFIVVGAGPAGATFARLLPAKYRVLIIERTNREEKCCGGLIAPDAQALLGAFDIGIPRKIVSDPQLLYVRSIDLETGRERNYQRHYMNIDRGLMDEHLRSMLPANVTLKTDCLYVKHEKGADGITVFMRSGSADDTRECRVLVGADGAFSKVRAAIYGDFPKIRKYLAIQGEYERLSPINHYAVFFDRTITDFYSWLIPKDGSVIIGGAFRENDHPRAKYDGLVSAAKLKNYGIGELKKKQACYVLRPRLRDIKIGEGGVALIGEAAGFISPSSAEGLSYAYSSALALARAASTLDGGLSRRYKRLTRALKVNIALKLFKSFFMYSHALRNIILRTKIGSLGKYR